MQGKLHRPALLRVGEGKVVSTDELAAWVRAARPGARCVYAAGPFLPKHLTSDLARRLGEQGRAYLTQARIDGGFEYILQVADPERAQRDAAQSAAQFERRQELTLLDTIERWLTATETPPSVFGLKVARDAKFVWRLRQGLRVRRSEMDAASDWMLKHPAPQTVAVDAAVRKAVG